MRFYFRLCKLSVPGKKAATITVFGNIKRDRFHWLKIREIRFGGKKSNGFFWILIIGAECKCFVDYTDTTTSKMANNVIELQKLFQSSTKPLWMRHPRSKFYVYPFWALFWGVTGVNLFYLGRAILGIKPKKN